MLVIDSDLLLGFESGLDGEGVTTLMEVLSSNAISNSIGAVSANIFFLLSLCSSPSD